MTAFIDDLREALRSATRAPGTTAVIVGTLALAIGLNTAIFSVVNGVLLRPLAYRDPDRLVHLRARLAKDGVENVLVPGATFQELRRSATSLADVAAATSIRQNLTGTELPVQVQVGWVSPNLFELLGVVPALGRGFADDEPPGRILLDDGFWRRQLGADPGVAGRTLYLDGHAYLVIGVMPPGFRLDLPRFPEQVDVWKVPDNLWQNGDVWGGTSEAAGLLRLVGRLKPGATLDEAQAEMDALSARLREGEAAYARGGLAIAVAPLHRAVVAGARPMLLLLVGAVAGVLLIACANVTHLLLVRGQARAREIAIRLAVGSSRPRLVRLLLLESAVLAFAGGALGLVLANETLGGLLALRPAGLPRAADIRLEPTVLAFALGLALACPLLVGLFPALAATRRDLVGGLHASRATTDARGRRTGAALVVGQVAATLVLLVASGLLALSLARLVRVNPGFDADRVLAFSVSLPGTRYERPEGTDRFLRRLEDEMKTLPGVTAAAVVWPLPLSDSRWGSAYASGDVDSGQRAYAEYRLATPALFDTLGIRVLEGRTFADRDPRHVVVVSRRLAERAWPGRSAVGRELRASPWGATPEPFAIVGVVDDVRFRSRREEPRETVYFDSRGWSWTDWEFDVVVRAKGDARALVAPIRERLLRLDPLVPMANARLLDEYLADDSAANRFALVLLSAFGATAFTLAVIGLYGVVAYGVGRRRRELGVRIALGAERARILRLVLGESARLVGLGVALGLLAALAVARLLQGLLFGVVPTEPVVFASAALALVATALFACYGPARRASRVDPALTLRAD